ncbi:MAG: GMC family oxidoreductase N-terminal domain-containing protein [Gammaproteobacteria bacterium]
MSGENDIFDYVVVGAGTGGCVVASRLAEDPSVRVALIEAGPDHTHPFIHVPATVGAAIGTPKLNWRFMTSPQPHLNNRPIPVPRGHVVGGSGSINGMVYFRGQPRDFDDWAAAGNPGWSYHEVLPYFLRSENNENFAGSPYHGQGGPMNVKFVPKPNPMSGAFLSAMDLLGYKPNSDFNGPDPEGYGPRQGTILNGRRVSTATAYLEAARKRPNFTLLTGTRVARVVIESGRATGVDVLPDSELARGSKATGSGAAGGAGATSGTSARSGTSGTSGTNSGSAASDTASANTAGGTRLDGARRLIARREVVVCGGAVLSPQILMLSGIGDGAALKAQGIEVRHHLPGVGANYHDHLAAALLLEMSNTESYGISLRTLPRGVANLIEYALFRSGPLSSNVFECNAFVRTRPELDRPDIQVVFQAARRNKNTFPFPLGHGYAVSIVGLYPKSRGHIRLASADPLANPIIDANLLSDPADVAPLLRGLQIARRIVSSRPFGRYEGVEVQPGSSVQTEEGLVEYIRRAASTVHHPCSSCRMGPDPNAVVDSQLRVHGVQSLRIADASVFPSIVGGNTNAPVVMVAEKCVDMMLGRPALKPVDPPYLTSPQAVSA